MSWGYYWRPYVPAAKRRANAKAYAAKLAKKEKRPLAPVELEGKKIAASFWGKAWCENLERYSDYDNRLPRGRTYVRNGAVIDLQMERGKVKAFVSGSQVYRVTIDISTLPAAIWSQIKKDCSRSIDSLIDLLQGKFDRAIMERLSQSDGGLFPRPREIKMACSCPDYAGMCKHVAATLYGVGARLDTAPELLFTLRGVDHLELISQAVDAGNLDAALEGKSDSTLRGSDLGEIFGIEIEAGGQAREVDKPPAQPRPRGARKPAASEKPRAKTTKKPPAPKKRKTTARSPGRRAGIT
ncbi:MAG: SWIM zinc finger family protein [Gemmataceae bacterium]